MIPFFKSYVLGIDPNDVNKDKRGFNPLDIIYKSPQGGCIYVGMYSDLKEEIIVKPLIKSNPISNDLIETEAKILFLTINSRNYLLTLYCQSIYSSLDQELIY